MGAARRRARARPWSRRWPHGREARPRLREPRRARPAAAAPTATTPWSPCARATALGGDERRAASCPARSSAPIPRGSPCSASAGCRCRVGRCWPRAPAAAGVGEPARRDARAGRARASSPCPWCAATAGRAGLVAVRGGRRPARTSRWSRCACASPPGREFDAAACAPAWTPRSGPTTARTCAARVAHRRAADRRELARARRRLRGPPLRGVLRPARPLLPGRHLACERLHGRGRAARSPTWPWSTRSRGGPRRWPSAPPT